MPGSSTAAEMQRQSLSRFPEIFDAHLQWYEPDQLPASPTALVFDALSDNSSLTEKLVASAGSSFRVHRYEECWCAIPNPGLRQQFGPVTTQHRFWSRKVLLYGKGEPWVLAHTLMPEHSACSELSRVLELGDKPLGRFLFSHPELLRANLQFVQTEDHLWGRRSVFYLFSKPIMVAEFFTTAYLLQLQAE